jgi:hypothetical protein
VLLKAEGRFVPLPIAASRAVKLGGKVATVGFPNIGLQEFAPKLAKGEIASLSGAVLGAPRLSGSGEYRGGSAPSPIPSGDSTLTIDR